MFRLFLSSLQGEYHNTTPYVGAQIIPIVSFLDFLRSLSAEVKIHKNGVSKSLENSKIYHILRNIS